jgi:hypothetical protein
MKCLIVARPMSTTIDDEAQGVSARFDVLVKTGTVENWRGTMQVAAIPFASSAVQMTSAIKTSIRNQLAAAPLGINVLDQDTFVFGASLTS